MGRGKRSLLSPCGAPGFGGYSILRAPVYIANMDLLRPSGYIAVGVLHLADTETVGDYVSLHTVLVPWPPFYIEQHLVSHTRRVSYHVTLFPPPLRDTPYNQHTHRPGHETIVLMSMGQQRFQGGQAQG